MSTSGAHAVETVLARAPGRVNLVGDYTDHVGGLVLTMAIDRAVEVELHRGVPWIELVSAEEDEPAIVFLDEPFEPAMQHPSWARYVAGVAAVVHADNGGRGFVRSTVPIGVGLASSAALSVAVAVALGFEGAPIDLALAARQAEQLATGLPAAGMDAVAPACGLEGHALLVDCTTLDVETVRLPSGAEVVLVDSGERRSPLASFPGVRRAQCEEAAELIGPLRTATLDEVREIAHDDLRRRARHVVTENGRVTAMAEALRAGSLPEAGRLMVESHTSLRDDLEASTAALDQLVDALVAVPGVHGARSTGGGFGGCVVALCDEGAVIDAGVGEAVWPVRASGGAAVRVIDRTGEG
jgi:galactokinase